MSISLFELSDEQIELERMMDNFAAENEGDVTDFPLNDEFGRLKGVREDKLLNVGSWIKSLRAEEAAHKAEQKHQGERARVLGNKASSLESLISYHLAHGEKLNNTRCALSFRRSEKVVIEADPEDMPKDLVTVTTTIIPNKKEIKARLKSDAGCEYGRIEECYNLQIK